MVRPPYNLSILIADLDQHINQEVGKKPWINKKELARLLGVHQRTLERWVALGRFPKPLRFSPHEQLWPRASLYQHLRSLAS